MPSEFQKGADEKRQESGAAAFAIDKGTDAALEFTANKAAAALNAAIDRLVDRVIAKVEDKLRMGK